MTLLHLKNNPIPLTGDDENMLMASADHTMNVDLPKLSFAIRDAGSLSAKEIEEIGWQQLHSELEKKGVFREVLLEHVADCFRGQQPVEAGHKPKSFYIPCDPVSTRRIKELLNAPSDIGGLAIAQKWIEGAGLKNIKDLFYIDGREVREQLMQDPRVQTAVDLNSHAIPKVRVMGSAVHTAALDLANGLAEKGIYFNQLNTDDLCPDWKENPQTFLGWAKHNLNLTAHYADVCCVSMLTTPNEAKTMAEENPFSNLSPEAVAEKARTFATTLQEVILPDEKLNVLLVDPQLHVIYHRENGKTITFDEAAYGKYLKDCGQTPSHYPDSNISGKEHGAGR